MDAKGDLSHVQHTAGLVPSGRCQDDDKLLLTLAGDVNGDMDTVAKEALSSMSAVTGQVIDTSLLKTNEFADSNGNIDHDDGEEDADADASDEDFDLLSLSSGALSDALPGADNDEDTFDMAGLGSDQDVFSKEQVEALHDELRNIGMMKFVDKYIIEQQVPIVKLLYAFGLVLPFDTSDVPDSALLPIFKVAVSRVLRRRRKLPDINTLDDAVRLISESKKIMILTGAGVSVSCGIPDFRSENGIYSMLGEYQLDDPQQMFDIDYFREAPHIFYSFAKELFPSNFKPSASHHFVRLVEEKEKLLRNYTQNIDTLEQSAGITRVLQCHGSFATASCIRCGFQVPGDEIKDDIFAQRIPKCKRCLEAIQTAIPKKRKRQRSNDDHESEDDDDIAQTCIVKPDIVFFGEKLSDEFDRKLFQDREEVDLLIIMGTSLKVAPVSEILGHVPPHVPQILINRTPVVHMGQFDVQLLGESDIIVQELCRRLGWNLRHADTTTDPIECDFVEPNVYLFKGAIWKGHGVSVDHSDQEDESGDDGEDAGDDNDDDDDDAADEQDDPLEVHDDGDLLNSSDALLSNGNNTSVKPESPSYAGQEEAAAP